MIKFIIGMLLIVLIIVPLEILLDIYIDTDVDVLSLINVPIGFFGMVLWDEICDRYNWFQN